jgi:hypothetical protein
MLGAMTPRIHHMFMAVVAGVSSWIAGWMCLVWLYGWRDITYVVSYGASFTGPKQPSPLFEHMDLYPWLTTFMWQHSFAVGLFSFITCLVAVWLYGRKKADDLRGQWLILLSVCFVLQVLVSVFMTLSASDARLTDALKMYWKIGH